MFIDPLQRNRFEFKYLIDERLTRQVRDFARAHLVRDRFARTDMAYCYPIYSVYLDNAELGICRRTIDGWRNRFKLRARFYNTNPANPVFFEIKRRVNDVIIKERAQVRRAAAVRLLAGYPAQQSDLVDPDDLKAWSSLERFCQLQRLVGATGKAFVAYNREAWNSPNDNSVRLTFDYDVRGAWYREKLDLPEKWARLRLEPAIILELKFTGRFPVWMRELAQVCNLTRKSVAKYVGCVQTLGQDSRLLLNPPAHADNDDD